MKTKDLIPLSEIQNIDDEECDTCYTFEKINERTEELRAKIDNIGFICPICREVLDEETTETIAIMGANFYSENHDVKLSKIYYCNKCEKYFYNNISEVIYNGSHDIYYTGADHYLSREDADKIKKDIDTLLTNDINQYTDRIKKGENLDSWNLKTWISYKIEELVAKILDAKGLK